MFKNLMYQQSFGVYRFLFFILRKNTKNKKIAEFEANFCQTEDTL